MGFRMRKSISLGKGVRVNVSKRGLSTSVKIGNTTLNTRGKATTRLAPGVSYETSLTGGRKRKTAKASGTKNRTASTSRVNRKDEKKRNARDRAAFREERMAEAGRFDGRSQSSDLPEISPDIVNEPTPYLDNKMGCGTASYTYSPSQHYSEPCCSSTSHGTDTPAWQSTPKTCVAAQSR